MKKMSVAIITLIFILISASPFLDTSSGTAFANENKPQEYIVEKTDSLWDISGRKLDDPFLWPRVWNVNPQIKNPNLIYPGTKIYIPSREQLLAAPTPPPGPSSMPLSILKRKSLSTMPKLVFEFPEEHLNKYIIEKKAFLKSGWIESKLPGIGKLLFTEKGSKLIDRGDIVYLETNGRSEPGSTYYTIKTVKKVRHPVTKEKMGQQIVITGTLKIIGSDNDVLKARVLSTFDDISVGDGIMPYKEVNPPIIEDNPRAPNISGHIVESNINSSISSKGAVIFLDKGSDDGVKLKDVFQIISDKPVRRIVGKLQIIRLQPDTSTAIILESSKEISIGDPWAQK